MRCDLLLEAALLLAVGSAARAEDAERIAFFEERIRPVLVERCFSCHSAEADEPSGGLLLDSRAGWERGGESGPALVPGKPEESLLMHAVRRSDKDLAMPPDEELPASVVADFVTWIERGAVDPRTEAASTVEKTESTVISADTPRFRWTFTRPAKPEVPPVSASAWPRNEIDRFVLAALESQSVTPAEIAEPAVLARRLYFDLTGLPPTPADIAAFVEAAAHDQPAAVAALVDQLLAGPQYGEKWGRHWLDVVRYADSLDARGMGGEGDILDAWRYRDWVVDAFNRDLPYDEFIRHQVAGDLLAARDWDPRKVIATGMYAIGNWGNGDSDKQKVHTDIVDDQVDVTSRAFLGLTLSCARCHDHKFDPLSTADYYGLAGFFFSSRILRQFAAPTAGETLMRITVLSPEEEQRRAELTTQLAELDAQLAGGLRPLSQRHTAIAGNSSLTGWALPDIANPSLTINTSEAVAKFVTITLDPYAVCVHPGPSELVTAVWQAPADGAVHVTASVKDADPNCGNGIEWSIRHGQAVLHAATTDNGGQAAFAGSDVTVKTGDLVRLVITPRSEYSCDSTQIEFAVREVQENGRAWDLRSALVASPAAVDLAATGFVVCAGDAESFAEQNAGKAALIARRAELAAQVPALVQCQGLQDGGIPGTEYDGFHDARIHVRGNYRRLGDVQPRGFPAVFQAPVPPLEGSGRIQLADWLASPDNPLTARVIVNRLWQHHFGAGLVRTPNNFGALGEEPTHPELLDWLACTFVEKGWSLKAMHRLMCTSAAYQQSSAASPQTLAADPDDRLFSRQNRRKLTAEELRDALLAVAGRLDLTRGGPSVNDLNSPRRTLYLTTVRSDRTSYQMLFDGADPTSIVERRVDSVVAPQALWLLNHPFALAQAQALAARGAAEGPSEIRDRLRWITETLYGRAPSEPELQLMESLLGAAPQPAAWERLSHALLCGNEFAFID